MHRRPSTNVTKFTAIAVNGFYTMTRSGLMTTADSDSPENIQCDELRTLAADEKAMKELYAQAEVLQTATQPKRLVVYKEYLLWFRDLPTNDEPRVPDSASTPHKGTLGAEALTSCSTSKASSPKRNTPVLEGYANIRGMYVESNHSTKIHTMELNTVRQGPTEQFFLHRQLPTLDRQTTECTKGEHNMETLSSQLCMMFCDKPNQLGKEGIYFADFERAEAWRSRLAHAPVFFTDYGVRYQEITEHLTVSTSKVCRVKDVSTGDVWISDSRKHPGFSDSQAYREAQNSVLEQFQVLKVLLESDVALKIRELHYTKSKFVLIFENTGFCTLGDWLDTNWSLDKLVNLTDMRITIQVLTEMTGRLLALHDSGVVHGSITRQAFWVELVQVSEMPTLHLKKVSSTYSDNKSGFTVLEGLRNGTQKLVFWLVGFQAGQILEKKLNWESIDMVQTYPDVYNSPVYQDNWQASASDVFGLGILFYEIVYGINIPEAISKEIVGEAEFVKNLLQEPQRYISLRAQSHRVGNDVEAIICSMLQPSWEKRPSIKYIHDSFQELLQKANNGEIVYSSQMIEEVEQVDLDDPPLSREGTATVWKEQTIQKHVSTSSNNPGFPAQPLLSKFSSQQPMKRTKTNPFEDSHHQKLESLEIPQAPVLKPTMSESYHLRNQMNSQTYQLKKMHLQKQPLKLYKISSANQGATARSDALPEPAEPALGKFRFQSKPLATNSGELKTPVMLKITSGNSETSRSGFEIESKGNLPQPPRLVLSLQNSRNPSPVPRVCLSGRSQFTPSNKLRRIILPAGESMINSGVHIIDHLIGSGIDCSSKPSSNLSKPTLQVPKKRPAGNPPRPHPV